MFVDEVQDASPIELRVLLDLTGKDRSVTLAGDVAQRMLDDDDSRGEFDWTRLLTEARRRRGGDDARTAEGELPVDAPDHRVRAEGARTARARSGAHRDARRDRR